jgi:hypothetical protein
VSAVRSAGEGAPHAEVDVQGQYGAVRDDTMNDAAAEGFILKDSHDRTDRPYPTLDAARRAVRSSVPVGARWEIRRLVRGGPMSTLVTSGRKA